MRILVFLMAFVPCFLQAQTLLKAGTYHNLKSDKPIVLKKGSFSFIGLQMNRIASSTAFRGSWIDGHKADTVRFFDCLFSGIEKGTVLKLSGVVEIENCIFEAVPFKIESLKRKESQMNSIKTGIEYQQGSSITVSNSTLKNLNYGIVFYGTTQASAINTIKENTFDNNRFGIYLANGNIKLDLRCNRFTLSCMNTYPSNGPAVTNTTHPCFNDINRVGLYVGAGVTITEDIGGPGGINSNILPAGNVWPVGNKSQVEIENSSYTLAGWAHLPNFKAVENWSEEGWNYFKFENEYFNSIDNSTTGNALEIPITGRFARTSTNQEIPPALTGQVDLVCDDLFGSVVFPLLPKKQNNEILSASPGIVKIETPILGQNIPNPANQSTSISYFLPASAKKGRLEIFEISSGKILKSFDILKLGTGILEFETRSLMSAIYGYRLLVDGQPFTNKKMVITH